MSSTNIQIAIKVRPLIEREKREKLESLWMVRENSIVQVDGTQNFIGEPYSFDHIFDDTTSNKDVYDAVVKPLVMSFLEGINATIFAYGQTSSGKTHTMLGDKNVPGIINFTVEDIFTYIEENTAKNFLIRCSYLEIYNEKINDLLDTNAKDVKIREDYNQGVYVAVKEEVIREQGELFNLMRKGMKTRKIGCTDMNERSSRSHTIFKLVIQSQNKDSEGSYTESTLSLVDLAGSERVGQMNMGRERQVEGVSINKSLTTLGLVIRKLSENETYINYRDSKLTRLLQHSLGGNSRTLIIATITVAAAEETKSTLEFAQRAKYVKNRPIVNERVTDKDQLKQYENLCEDYKDQIEKLRLEKLERDRTINVLEDKILNIKLFSARNFEKSGKLSRIPQRRHTLGHYKPHKKQFLVMNSDELEDNSDSDNHVNIISPVKSEVCLRVTNADDKENSFFENSEFGSPFKFVAFEHPSTPKTPFSKLRLEKELLEESYIKLKSFIDHEKELQGESDVLEAFRDLTDRLREENTQLKQDNLKLIDFYTKVRGDNRDIHDKLIILRTILDVQPFEEIRRLQPIVEEDIDLFSNNLDSSECISEISHCQNEEENITIGTNEKYAALIEEIQTLKLQINDNERIINDLKNDISTEKLNTELVLSQLNEENRCLRNQIDIKDATIEKLKNNIIQDKAIKEAELEILNNKIKKLSDYKEEMHKKLSEPQKVQETLLYEEEIASLKQQNAVLKEDLQSLRTEYTRIQQFAESDKRLIEQLKEEIEALTKSISEKVNLSLQKQSEVDTLEKSNEMLLNQLNNQLSQQYDYATLKEQNDRLNAEVVDLKFLLNGEQKELAKLNQELEDKSKYIENMEKTMCNLKNDREEEVKNLTDINVHLRLEIAKIKEEIDLMRDVNVKLKGELELNLNIKQQFDENVAQMDLLKMKMNEFISLEQVINDQKADINDLKNQLHSKASELDEKTMCYNDLLSKHNVKMSEFEHLAKENSELMQKLDEENKRLKIELQDAMFQLGGEQKELEKMCLQLDEKTQKIDALEKIISDFKSNREIQTRDIQELRDINSALRDDLHKAEHINLLHEEHCSRAKCQSSRQELEQIKEQFMPISTKLTEMTELYNSAMARDCEKNNLIKTLKEQTEKLENERQLLEEHTVEVNSLKEERKMLVQRIENLMPLEQTVDTLSRDMEVIQFELETQKNESDDLRTQLVSIKAELEEKTKMYSHLLLKFDAKKEENQQYVEQIATLQEEISDMKKQLEKGASLEATLNRYLEDIHKLETLCEANKHEISELKSQLHLKVTELGEKTNAYDDLLNKYKLKLGESTKLNEEVECLKNEKEHLTECINSHVSLKEKIVTYIKEIQDLQNICEGQKTKIENLGSRLDLKERELVERTESYNKLLADYTSKKDGYQRVSKELENMKIQLKQTLDNNASLEQTVCRYLNDIQLLQETSKNLKKEKNELKHRLDNSGTLEQTIRNYVSDIKLLQATSTAQKSEIKELKDKLLKLREGNATSESDDNVVKDYKIKVEDCRYKGEGNTLRKRLNNLSELHHYDSNREGIELLTNSSFTDEVKSKIQEVNKLQEDIRFKSEEIERICEDRNKLKVLVQELETSLSDIKRQLKERCEDYFHLKSKNNALEIQLFNCKKNLATKNQELQSEKMRMASLTAILQNNAEPEWRHLSPEEQIAKHMSKENRLKRELEDAQQEIRCQTLQMKQLQEEIEKNKRSILDTERIRSEHEKCIQVFKGIEQELSEIESKHLLERYDAQEKSNKIENKIIALDEPLLDRLKTFERCYALLKSQHNAEKSKFAFLDRKLLDAETLVATLQAKVHESEKSKKKTQECQLDKNPVPRISDENRPMSPNDLRKIKRRSIHDQRRGLAPDSGGSFEDDDLDCKSCIELRVLLGKCQEEKKSLVEETDNLKKENTFLGKENEGLLQIIKEQKKRGLDLHEDLEKYKNCKHCIELKMIKERLCECQEENKTLVIEIDNLKKENEFLDKENEDMLKMIKELEKTELDLYEELEKYKNSSSSATDLDKIKIQLNDMIKKNGELQDEIATTHKLIEKYKHKIFKLERTQREEEDRTTRTDSPRPCSKENKGIQVTCDLQQANINLRKIARLRRIEGNYLRAKLNLPPDCPVLPEDLQRQPNSETCAPR